MRKVFGKKAIYPSDIGCYTMAVGMGTVDTCLCMGASITLASGIRFGGLLRRGCRCGFRRERNDRPVAQCFARCDHRQRACFALGRRSRRGGRRRVA